MKGNLADRGVMVVRHSMGIKVLNLDDRSLGSGVGVSMPVV